ncbi:hypothetical protein QG37_03668 [Candidozyma auris]|uniref:Uncharacterized protein n=1 Tax=Candidozyma auris TaxID=498019 RepID=A0A0L0NZG6_CANAR|nr:hypothetical protein QG37_03668 [[Candida] auris]
MGKSKEGAAEAVTAKGESFTAKGEMHQRG